MIDFEFSNGHPYKPLLEDDHEYVEYPLQHIEGLPCNAEEEERVSFFFIRRSCCPTRLTIFFINQTSQHLSVGKLLQMLMEAVLLSLQDLEPKLTAGDDTSAVTNHSPPIKTEPLRASTASSSDAPSQFVSPCNSTSSAEQSSNVTPSVVSSSNADVADRTKAMVTVEKGPSSNIMDGLLKRWDLNFFKSR